jgi:hypothetical protein
MKNLRMFLVPLLIYEEKVSYVVMFVSMCLCILSNFNILLINGADDIAHSVWLSMTEHFATLSGILPEIWPECSW